MLRLSTPYVVAATAILLIEIAIALWVRDAFVRPYLGDVLAVVLVYLGLRAVTRLKVVPAAALAFLTGAAVEFGQWFGLLRLLHLEGNPVARVVLGASFGWEDIACYAAAAGLALAVERLRAPH